MSPTLIYDPEVITTTPAVSRVERGRPRPSSSPGPDKSSRPFKFPRLIAALLVAASVIFIVALTIVFAEIALHVLGLGEDEYIKVDPVLGVTHLENKWVVFRHEGFSKFKTSSAGLRDVEHQVAKPPGVKRIAFLGDSKTQALQVSIEDTFVRLVQNDLNAGQETEKFETINFGMANYGLVQYYVNFLARVRQYSPDVTVVVYHIFDSAENVPKKDTRSMPSPTVALNKNNELSLDYSFLDEWINREGGRLLIANEWWRRNCRLYQALLCDDFMLRYQRPWYAALFKKAVAPIAPFFEGRQDAHKMQEQAFARFGDWKAARKAVIEETRVLDKQVSHDDVWTSNVESPKEKGQAGSNDSALYKMMHDKSKADANLACRVFRMLNLACRNADSKLVVVPLQGTEDMVFYFREIETIKKLAQQEGFTVIDANAQFPRLAAMQESPLYYNVHLTAAGHRKVAGIIAEGLKPLLK